MFISKDEKDAVGALESALASTLACEPLQAGLEKARKEGKLKMHDELQQIAEARELGIIDAEQALQLQRDYALRRKVIMVDDFASEELQSGKSIARWTRIFTDEPKHMYVLNPCFIRVHPHPQGVGRGCKAACSGNHHALA